MGKRHSEDWNEQLSLVGAVIGWTRGTGLMSGNNVVAAGMEKTGLHTFRTTEMGFNLTALMHPSMVDRAADSPIYADLTGGMALVSDLKDQVDALRAEIMEKARIQASIHTALENEKKLLPLASKQSTLSLKTLTPRSNMLTVSVYTKSAYPSSTPTTLPSLKLCTI